MKKTILFIGLVCMALFSLVSCSEKEDTIDDYNNWQQKNDDYWTTLYNATQQKVASGDSTWKCYLNWSLEGQLPNISGSTLSYSPTDYIIVHVEKTGTGTVSPLYTDSVQVHYQGRLIPSETYTKGLIFDASWTGDYNLETMQATGLYVKSVVDGFATALMHMHIGDRWTVYMPYRLGYGAQKPQSSSVIQPYSNLIFDITLTDIIQKK